MNHHSCLVASSARSAVEAPGTAAEAAAGLADAPHYRSADVLLVAYVEAEYGEHYAWVAEAVVEAVAADNTAGGLVAELGMVAVA